MKNDHTIADNGSSLRYGMLVPLAFMIASFITSCLSYSDARECITKDLNDAMLALVNENRELWTQPDTITALRQMHATTNKPLIYKASDADFRYPALKDEAYFMLALVDKNNAAPNIPGNKIASDSIMIIPQRSVDGLALQVQGFAYCSMASVFSASDQTLPGILFSLSMLSMAAIFIRGRKTTGLTETLPVAHPVTSLPDDIRLTPMQRQFTQMLLDAPDMRVDKKTLCEALWGNKINAEESLYTLVRRTKTALAKANMKIICNRGDSYELRVND